MDQEQRQPDGPPAVSGTAWERRPWLSRALRWTVTGGPMVASFVVAVLLSRALPRADGVGPMILMLAIVISASLLTLLVLVKVGTRLLPLAALLNLSLIFPDKAPARFAVARRTGKPSELQASLRRASEAGHVDEAVRTSTIIELVLALSVHDRGSRGHSERVRVFTDLLAEELKLPDADRNRLRWAALLHDIGKLEVSPAILNKPGKPSDAEWEVLHRHPEEGARLVASLLPWLGTWGLAVAQHHERFDGTGYPNQLRGHEISYAARIVSVADSYEVMTAPRAYKRPMSVAAARRELVRGAGTQFDPAVVRAFLSVSVGNLWRAVGVGAWVSQAPALARLFSFGGFGGAAGAGGGAGIAAAAAASVLAVAGTVGPAPAAAAVAGAARPAIAAAPAPQPPTLVATPAIVTETPTVAVTAAPAPTAPATPASTRRPTPSTPAPTAAPQPTPVATPTPAPNPWACPGCTNTSSTCTSYCQGADHLHACTTYCISKHNDVCTSHCFGGGDNPVCVQYCVGNNPKCTSSCSKTQPAALTSYVAWRSRELLQAESVLTATMTTTSPMVIRPLY